MSGGSYDYAYCGMKDGDLDKAVRNIDSALSDFDRFAAEPMLMTKRVDRQDVPLTREDVILTEAGLSALRRRLRVFAERIRLAQQDAKELSDLFHDLEWIDSCDYAKTDLQETARKWAREKLG